ncbi:hypothetical protein CXG81DRAFT_26654, partial [Caulochytrium protostelioides]
MALDDSAGRAKWTESLEDYLLDLIIDGVQRNNYTTTGNFKKAMWNDITTTLNSLAQTAFTRDQVISKYRQGLKKDYARVRDLLEGGDFHYDPATKFITTASDTVRAEYIDRHPWSRRLLMQPFGRWPRLQALFIDGESCGVDRETAPNGLYKTDAAAIAAANLSKVLGPRYKPPLRQAAPSTR